MAESQANASAQGAQGSSAPGADTSSSQEQDENQALNKAITKRLKNFEEKFGERLDKRLKEFSTALTTSLKEAVTSQAGGAGATAGSGTSDGQQDDIEKHPAFRGLLKRVSDAEAKQKAAEEQAAATHARERMTRLEAHASKKLAELGIEGIRAHKAIGDLVHVSKLVKYESDDSDEIVFVDKDGDIDLDTGIKSWSKTEDAKIYLPPRGASGSGDRPGGRSANAAGHGAKVDANAIGQMVLESFASLPVTGG
ncbi:MAG TPA: hypothetical protein VFT22_10910 [Kofleriaceae bacterium]|nr:hypothetical protein [Kofleriaceae bacterium]